MIKIITISDVKKLIHVVGIQKFFQLLIAEVEKQYSRWDFFQKSMRHAIHLDQGVIELMPICDDELYSFKYVNGHPINTAESKLTVVAVGMLSDIRSGYPLLISEMTLLTAFRTAATSALASRYLARKNTKTLGIIGTGAQSEFQVLAHCAAFDIKAVKYFDIDRNAMKKFHDNLSGQAFQLIACDDAQSVLENSDIITTATAAKSRAKILENDWIKPGLHINGIGGDCPGKTELDKNILARAKIVVEYLPQSKTEGEIQQADSAGGVYAELWELASGVKKGRESDNEITLFDSVGFALEDFAVLKLVHELSIKNNIGESVELIPSLRDPKNLFGVL